MGTVALGTLTDAELALLTRPRSRIGPRPVMPVWSRLDTDQRLGAARQARASLVSRRLLEPHGRSAGDVRRDLRSVLALRQAAAAVLAVARAAPTGRDHWYAHVLGEVVVLEEVSGEGRHRFTLAAAATLPELAAAAVLHPRAGPGADPDPGALTTWLRADLELRTATATRRGTWVSGPGGTWQVPGGPQTPDDVRRHLHALLAEVGAGEAGP